MRPNFIVLDDPLIEIELKLFERSDG